MPRPAVILNVSLVGLARAIVARPKMRFWPGVRHFGPSNQSLLSVTLFGVTTFFDFLLSLRIITRPAHFIKALRAALAALRPLAPVLIRAEGQLGAGGLFRAGPGEPLSRPRRAFPALLSLVMVVALAGLTACSFGAGTTGASLKLLTEKGSQAGFRPVTFKGPRFTLMGMLRGQPGDSDYLVVYIEGDGRGVVRGQVTEDPTPLRAMGFELATFDPASSVLYLARVGQFQPSQTGRKYQDYWSNKRLSEESVEAADLAISQAKEMTGATRIHLIGYSGGGGLAVLLAQRRGDVATLTTVAGLLDTLWWVREKNFQPLDGSLNPADQAPVLAKVPQVHFFGSEDLIIPPRMSAHFKTLASFANFRRVEVPTNHWRDWPVLWPGLLHKYLLPLR